MSSELEHLSHPQHPLILFDTFLKECVVTEEDATCIFCQLPVIRTPSYSSTNRRETFYAHKSCVEEYIIKCYGCGKTVVGFPTYVCYSDDSDCQGFYLHKTCALLPKQINHDMHKKHPLSLLPRRDCICNVCRRGWRLFTYTCLACDFDVCVFCAFKHRALGHEGHKKNRPGLEEHKGRVEEHWRGGKKNRLEHHFSHPRHPLTLISDDEIAEEATCHICDRPVKGSPTYACTFDDIDCQQFCLHSSCAELPKEFHLQNHKQHSVVLKPCPDCVCDICGVDVKFAYACGACSSFIVCVFCASEDIRRAPVMEMQMQAFSDAYETTLTLEHFSHPKHTLRVLKKYDVIEEDEKCHICNKPVIGSPAYTCTEEAMDCERFFLHKTCADLPLQLKHNLDTHLLRLLPRPDGHLCAVCACNVKYAYACDNCNTNVCVFCGFEQRVMYHEGHHQHNLTLQRKALFKCDACSEKSEDYSYVCTPCDFWIHKSCAFAPSIIPNPAYHHHPLSLVYSIPEMHRYFSRSCNVCFDLIERHHWLYYCHQCTFFVHMKCSTSKAPSRYTIQYAYTASEPDLVQFPLSSEESLFDLIVTQCAKLHIDFQSEGESSSITSTITDNPLTIEAHWSHPEHPLVQLQFTENDNDDEDSDDRRVLICNGCIQPITLHHPCYYACVECDFLLHSFCATKLPGVFPAEAFPSHPNHSLVLHTSDFFALFKCGTCNSATNGFFYRCDTCDMTIDIRCAFLPSQIKHESHKHHSLVQRPPSNFICSVSKLRVMDRAGYACESCGFFQIDILCAFYPSRIKHRYDEPRDITLRHPPFFYEGVIYCELCEEQVNNQWWLYHCTESDHSYHHNCLQWHENVKLGRSIVISSDDEKHTFSVVLKRTTRRNSPWYICQTCNKAYKCSFFIECHGCGILVCLKCLN